MCFGLGERGIHSEDEQTSHVSVARNWRGGVLRFHPGIVGHSIRCAKVRTHESPFRALAQLQVCGDRLGYKLDVSAVTSKKIWVVLERRVMVRFVGFAITPEQSCIQNFRFCPFFIFVFIFFKNNFNLGFCVTRILPIPG